MEMLRLMSVSHRSFLTTQCWGHRVGALLSASEPGSVVLVDKGGFVLPCQLHNTADKSLFARRLWDDVDSCSSSLAALHADWRVNDVPFRSHRTLLIRFGSFMVSEAELLVPLHVQKVCCCLWYGGSSQRSLDREMSSHCSIPANFSCLIL